MATEAERRLLDEAASGELIDVSALTGDERAVSAKVLREVCVGPGAEGVPANGIYLQGAIIDEPVDLRWCEIPFPLWFKRTSFRGGLGLTGARTPSVALVDCVVLGAMHAQRAELSYGLTVRGGIVAASYLNRAVIGGDLDLVETTLSSPPGAPAMFATSIDVGGSLRLTQVNAIGTVDFAGAHIGSHFECAESELAGKRDVGVAVNLDKAEIGGSLLVKRTTARGAIYARGCSVGGSFACEGSAIVATDGVALWFDGADIQGNFAVVQEMPGAQQPFCRPFVEGAVRVNGAQIRGALMAQHADLYATSGEALMVSGTSVGMAVAVVNARLDGDVWLTDTTAQALVDDLDETGGSWRTVRRLVLTGFRYDRFEGGWDSGLRFAWLRATDGHQPQAWTQLADVYRRNGREGDARRAAVARENDRLERGGLGRPERAGRWILRLAIGHGYRPWLAAVWSLAIVALFALLRLRHP